MYRKRRSLQEPQTQTRTKVKEYNTKNRRELPVFRGLSFVTVLWSDLQKRKEKQSCCSFGRCGGILISGSAAVDNKGAPGIK